MSWITFFIGLILGYCFGLYERDGTMGLCECGRNLDGNGNCEDCGEPPESCTCEEVCSGCGQPIDECTC